MSAPAKQTTHNSTEYVPINPTLNQSRATPNTKFSVALVGNNSIVSPAVKRRNLTNTSRKRRGAMLQSAAISTLRTKQLYTSVPISYGGSPLGYRYSPTPNAVLGSVSVVEPPSNVNTSTFAISNAFDTTSSSSSSASSASIPIATMAHENMDSTVIHPPVSINKPLPLNAGSRQSSFSRPSTTPGKSCLKTPSRPNTPHNATPGGGQRIRWWDDSNGPPVVEDGLSSHTTPSIENHLPPVPSLLPVHNVSCLNEQNVSNSNISEIKLKL